MASALVRADDYKFSSKEVSLPDLCSLLPMSAAAGQRLKAVLAATSKRTKISDWTELSVGKLHFG